MKSFIKVLPLLLLTFRFAAAANPSESDCYPEIGRGDGRGDEVLRFVITGQKTVSLYIGNQPVSCLQNAPYTENGNVDDYGEASLEASDCKGRKVIFLRQWDEEILDVTDLELGLSDDRYICE